MGGDTLSYPPHGWALGGNKYICSWGIRGTSPGEGDILGHNPLMGVAKQMEGLSS